MTTGELSSLRDEAGLAGGTSRILGSTQESTIATTSEVISFCCGCIQHLNFRQLCKTCRITFPSIPSIPSEYRAKIWSDLVTLSSAIRSGQGVPLYLGAIATANALGLKKLQLPVMQDYDDPLELDYVTKQVCKNLCSIFEHASNLMSIHWEGVIMNENLEKIWTSLQRCPLESLILAFKLAQGQNQRALLYQSTLFNLCTLTMLSVVIPIKMLGKGNAPLSGLARLVNNCSRLKSLSVIVKVDEWTAPYGGDEMLLCRGMSQLEYLNLENVIASESKALSAFLRSLVKVKHLRFVQRLNFKNDEDFDMDSDVVDRHNNVMFIGEDVQFHLPNLQELETDTAIAEAILYGSKPAVLRNVRLRDGIELSEDTISAPMFKSTSLKEIHLVLYGFETNEASCRLHAVAALGRLPDSIELLSIAMPTFKYGHLTLGHAEFDQDIYKALSHLRKLKKIILPWHAIRHAYSHLRLARQAEQQAYILDDAKQIAVTLSRSCPDLELVIFQDSRRVDETNDPAWKIRWGAYDDAEKRWAISVQREAGDQRGDFFDFMVSDARVDEINTTCLCWKCIQLEDEEGDRCTLP